MSASDLDHLIQELAMLMNSDDQDHGAEAARQLRVLSMDNRSAEHPAPYLLTCPRTSRQSPSSLVRGGLPLPACVSRLPSLADSP